MRIPSYTPPAKSTEITLGDMRELLKVARKNPRTLSNGETDADVLELLIAEREIKSGLRADITLTPEQKVLYATPIPR